MRRFLVSAAVAAGMLAVTTASSFASTCTGTCVGIIPSSVNPNGAFSDVGILNGASISDQWDFTLVAPPAADNEFANEITVQPGSITGLTVALYAVVGNVLEGMNNAPVVDASGQHISLAVNGLPASLGGTQYYLLLTGTAAAGANSGILSYSGNISTTGASNVGGTPLPGTLALFAGGLGLLGFTGWRKRNKERGGVGRLSLA